MINNVYASETIAVDSAAAAPVAPAPIEAAWTSLVPMVLIFVVFYFFLIRPQEKKRKAQEAFISGVKRGEEIVTNSGIYGTITKINENDNSIMLEVSKGVEIKISKISIADILSRKTVDPKEMLQHKKSKSDSDKKTV